MKKPIIVSLSVYPIRLGLTVCYLIKDKGAVLFDAGMPRKINRFKRSLSGMPVDPSEISLIILSHAHFDHAGTAKDIREFTGARILIHREDETFLEQSRMVWPKGVTRWGKISAFIFKIILKRVMRYPHAKPDMVMDTEEFSLREYGIDGRILHTPGHTRGSVSVLLESGELFAGCMAHNRFPFRLTPGLPIYADDIEELKQSWKKILPLGVKIVYPAHGRPFHPDKMKKELGFTP